DLGGTPIGDPIIIPALAVGASAQVSVPWTPALAGAHTIFVIADPANTISELDETNNEGNRTVEVAPNILPDLAVTAADLSVAPVQPVEGDTVTVSLYVHNIGGSPVSLAAVRFYDGDPAAGGQPIGQDQEITSLVPGGRQQVQIEWPTVGLTGTHRLYAVVDPGLAVAEVSEANNQAYLDVALTPLGLTASIATDLPEYGPGAPVQIHAALTDTSGQDRTFSYEVLVEDADGVLVTSLGTYPAPLAAGATLAADHAWNTGTTLAGQYRARLRVFAGDRLVADVTAPFAITAQTTLDASLLLNQVTFRIGDTVVMDSRVLNTSPNYIYEHLTATVAIRNGSGATLASTDHAITTLVQNADARFTDAWATAMALPGAYEARLTVQSGEQVLAEVIRPFTVEGIPLVTGQITVPTLLLSGQDLAADVALRNDGTAPFSGLVEVLVADPAAPGATEPVARAVVPVDLAPGAEWLQTVTLPQLSALPGQYVVVLRLLQGDEAVTLDSEGLTVSELLTVEQQVTGAHRALVYAKTDAEVAFYSNLLTHMGIPFLVVTDRIQFIEELRSDQYDLFIMGDISHHLKEDYDQELVERIYGGAGLIATLGAVGDDLKVSGLFGFDWRGAQSGTYTVQSPVGDLAPQSSLIRALPTVGETLATMVSAKDGSTAPAIVANPFGHGQVVYFAFNPALATGPAEQLAMSMVERVLPELQAPTRPGQTAVVAVTVTSLGLPVDLRVTESLPEGWQWADGTTGQSRTVELSLAGGETRTLAFAVRIPLGADTGVLTTKVEYYLGGEWFTFLEEPVTLLLSDGLTPLQLRIGDAIAALRPLLAVADLDRLARVESEVGQILAGQPATVDQLDYDIHRLAGVFDTLDQLLGLDEAAALRTELGRLLALLESAWFYGRVGQ
ncbi:MAG TPA: CARDB domain-containing protein, partial [Symbiobacteriaceae bacterium]|nr:CARDB domain-containing protein [Symbiobacteriaceae bacterium]